MPPVDVFLSGIHLRDLRLMLCFLSHTTLRSLYRHVSRTLTRQFPPRAVRSMATNPPNGSISISTSTSDVQTLMRDGQEYTEVKEGLARILVPFSKPDPAAKATKNVEEQQHVFYNPIQQFNRDLTVLAIKAYGKSLLSKPSSANAKHVAKRKRDRSDASGPNSKRQQEQPAHVTDTADPAPHSDMRADEMDISMAEEDIEVLGKDGAVPSAATAAADQPLPETAKNPNPRRRIRYSITPPKRATSPFSTLFLQLGSELCDMPRSFPSSPPLLLRPHSLCRRGHPPQCRA